MSARALGAASPERGSELDGSAGSQAALDDVRREWATALLAAVPTAPAALLPGLREEVSPAVWRPTDASMTEPFEELRRQETRGFAPSATEGGPALLCQLGSAVETGSLGRVAFVVDRSNDGLSIVAEVETEPAARAIEADRQALFRSLRLAGLTVISFRVLVRPVGTPLAGRQPAIHVRGQSLPRSRRASGSVEPDDDDAPVDPVG